MRAIQYYKKLLSLSIPVLFSSISTLLANILLTTIVGHHSIEAMVVVGSATVIMLIFNNSLYASCIGYRICFSKALGEQNYKNLNSIFCSGLIFGLIISCFFSSILLIFAKQITYYIKLNYIQSQQVTNYLTVIAFSYIPQSITLILLFTFSSYEYTKFFLYINGIFGLLNIFINITLIYGLLIFPTLGFIIGAAWSHSITTLLSFITVFLLFIRYNKKFNLKLIMDRNYLSLLFRLSYPSIISMFLDYLGSYILLIIMSHYLEELILASGRLVFTLTIFCFSIISSMGSGFMILGGKALGSKNIEKFEAYNQYNKFLLLIISGILAFPLLFLPNKILRILTSFNDIAHYAYSSTILLAFTLPLLAIYITKATYLRLIGKVKLDMVCNIVALWFIQIPTAYYCLIVYFHLGLISFAIAFIIHQISYIIITSKIQYKINSP